MGLLPALSSTGSPCSWQEHGAARVLPRGRGLPDDTALWRSCITFCSLAPSSIAQGLQGTEVGLGDSQAACTARVQVRSRLLFHITCLEDESSCGQIRKQVAEMLVNLPDAGHTGCMRTWQGEGSGSEL